MLPERLVAVLLTALLTPAALAPAPPPAGAPPAPAAVPEPQPPSIDPPFSGYERTVTLAPDLSGTARSIHVLNMETWLAAAAESGGGMKPAEVTAMREKWATLLKNSEKALPAWRASVESRLPAGVKLVGAWQKTVGFKSITTFVFRFDQVAKLASIDLASSRSKPSPKDRPFAELSFTREDGTLLVASQPAEPPRGKDAMDLVLYRLESPLEVLEANATRREGGALIWEFDSLEIHDSGKAPPEVRARLRLSK